VYVLVSLPLAIPLFPPSRPLCPTPPHSTPTPPRPQHVGPGRLYCCILDALLAAAAAASFKPLSALGRFSYFLFFYHPCIYCISPVAPPPFEKLCSGKWNTEVSRLGLLFRDGQQRQLCLHCRGRRVKGRRCH
jgi:hypothetical protein